MSIPVDSKELRRLIVGFLHEDVGSGDLTTNSIVPAALRAEGRFVARQECILAGIDIIPNVFDLLDPGAQWTMMGRDGRRIPAGKLIARVRGRARALLTGERVALNILQRLSGIATLTQRFVHAVRNTKARILDTRKTTPGWRTLEKYAVRCGGGYNHRIGLFDAILIKDNHLAVAGGVRQAVERARRQTSPNIPLEVEISTPDQLQEALELRVNHVLLDNMTPGQVRRCIGLIRQQSEGRKVIVECSGGIDLRSVKYFARAGADWISVGALTHSAPATDISFEIDSV